MDEVKDEINESLNYIEEYISNLKTDITKVNSMKTDVSSLKQNLRIEIKDKLKRSRMPKGQNNAMKLIEFNQPKIFKLCKESANHDLSTGEYVE